MPTFRHRLTRLIPPALILRFIAGLTALQRRLERLRSAATEMKHGAASGVSSAPTEPSTGPAT